MLSLNRLIFSSFSGFLKMYRCSWAIKRKSYLPLHLSRVDFIFHCIFMTSSRRMKPASRKDWQDPRRDGDEVLVLRFYIGTMRF